MMELPAKVVELEDDPDKVYVFGFHDTADPSDIQHVAQAIDSKFDHARILMFAGEIESDLIVDEVNFVLEGHPKQNGGEDETK